MYSARCVVNLESIPVAGTLINESAVKLAGELGDEAYRRQAKTQWATQGESTGTRWDDLTWRYRRRKGRTQRAMRAMGRAARKFAPVKDLQGPEIKAISTDVLVLHGNLRRAYSYKNELHVGEGTVVNGVAIFTYGATGAEKYWHYHREGKGNNPVRDFTQRTPAQIKEIVRIIRNSLWASSEKAKNRRRGA